MPVRYNYTGSQDLYTPSNKSEQDQGLGLKYPFGISKRAFDVTTESIEAARSNILLLLHTEKGERIMKPDVGLNLLPYCFEPIEESTKLAIETDIKEAINNYVPYVTIYKLNVNISEDNQNYNKIYVNIIFALKKQPEIRNELEHIIAV